MSDTINIGDIVRTRGMRSPAMLVINKHIHNEDLEFVELLWFDANMNARQLTLGTTLLEHVPLQD